MEACIVTDLRKAASMALDAMLSEYSTGGENKYSPWDVIEALRQALAQPDNTSDSATRSADSAESFCKQELHNLMSVAGRMALELECLLLDTKDLSVVSKWWDTGMESLQAYRDYIWSITHGKNEIVAIAQPKQEPNNWWDDKEYVKSRFGDNAKIVSVKRGLPAGAFKPISEPVKERISEPVENLEPIALKQLRDLHKVQGSKGCYDIDPYMCGLYNGLEIALSLFEKREPMFKEPDRSKREWVGLTDEEIDYIFVDYGWCISTLYLRVVRSIEAKLKEKNT